MNELQKNKPQLIPLSIAQQHVPYSRRHLRTLCEQGRFETAVKPNGERGQWFIQRSEIVSKANQKPDAK